MLGRAALRLPVQALKRQARCMSGTVLHTPLNVLTEEEAMLKETVSKWAQEKVAPRAMEMDKNAKIDPEIFDDMFQNGFMGIEIPEEYGGSGMSFLSAIVAIEEIAKEDASVAVAMDVQNTLVNNFFLRFAQEELRQRYMPELATKKVGSFALSESGSGSDAFALQTKAEENADGDYVINGSKLWITNAGEAEIFLVQANVDPSKGYKGITTFVVEREQEGFEIGPKEDKLGIRASSTCPLTFNDVLVKKENVLGEIGSGYKYAIWSLNEGRIGIAAQAIGIAQGIFDKTMPYIRDRKQFGTAIWDFQGVTFQYAQLATEIEAARLMTYNAARKKMAGENFVKEAAMAKLFSSQVCERVCSKCVELVGGVGFTNDMVSSFVLPCLCTCLANAIISSPCSLKESPYEIPASRQFTKEPPTSSSTASASSSNKNSPTNFFPLFLVRSIPSCSTCC